MRTSWLLVLVLLFATPVRAQTTEAAPEEAATVDDEAVADSEPPPPLPEPPAPEPETVEATESPVTVTEAEPAEASAGTSAAGTSAAETSALPAGSVAAGDFEMGFSPSDGAYLRTHDRSWELRIGLLFQFRAGFSNSPDPSREIEFVPVMGRLYFQGSVVQSWIRYFAQVEFVGQQNPFPAAPVAEAPRLLDFWVEAQPHEAFGVRMGLMRPPMSRSWIIGLQRQVLFDRTDANLFYRNHGTQPLASAAGTTPVVPWDRDIGIMVFGTPAGGLFEYYAGVFNGNGFLFGRNEADSVMPLVRVAVNPLGSMANDETLALRNPHQDFRLQIGASAYYNHYRAFYTDATMTAQTGTEEQYTLEGDVTAAFESVYLSTELYYRNRLTVDGNRHDEVGAMGLASWMFLHPYLEVAGRFSIVDPNLSSAGNFRQTYDIGLNVYPSGNNLRFGLRYTAALNDAAFPGGSPGAPFTVPAGTLIHTVGIWSQLYF